MATCNWKLLLALATRGLLFSSSNKVRCRWLLGLAQWLEGIEADICDCLSLAFRSGHEMAAQVLDIRLQSSGEKSEGKHGISPSSLLVDSNLFRLLLISHWPSLSHMAPPRHRVVWGSQILAFMTSQWKVLRKKVLLESLPHFSPCERWLGWYVPTHKGRHDDSQFSTS